MRTPSRPTAGSMNKTIGTRVSPSECASLLAMADEMDRPLSWLNRQGLIQYGLISQGK